MTPAPPAGPERPATRRSRRVAGRLGDAALMVAAAFGTTCLVVIVAALCFGVRLTMFATGSMAPTIPTGSVAVTRQVPVGQVQVGDVVTVQRPGQLPVTHRIQSIDTASDGTRELVLKGDANTLQDAQPYHVTQVGLVMFSVPGVARLIVTLSHRPVLGAVTLAAAALILWAFWPRRRSRAVPSRLPQVRTPDPAGAETI